MEKIRKILLFLPILALSTKAEWVVKSYQEIKNERVIRQTYEESCGQLYSIYLMIKKSLMNLNF